MVRASGQVRGPRVVLYLRVLPRGEAPGRCDMPPWTKLARLLGLPWRLGFIQLVHRATQEIAGSLQSREKRVQSLCAVFAGRAAGMVVDGRGWCEAVSIF